MEINCTQQQKDWLDDTRKKMIEEVMAETDRLILESLRDNIYYGALQVARDYKIAIPSGLTDGETIDYVNNYVLEHLVCH